MIAEPEPPIRARQIEREVMDVRRKHAHCVKREADGARAAQRQAGPLRQRRRSQQFGDPGP